MEYGVSKATFCNFEKSANYKINRAKD